MGVAALGLGCARTLYLDAPPDVATVDVAALRAADVVAADVETADVVAADVETADVVTADVETADGGTALDARDEARGDAGGDVDEATTDAPRDAPTDGSDERAAVCGDGHADPVETCATCPEDLLRRSEEPNDEDDNCDGQVDEGLRLKLYRLHCSDHQDCGNPTLDWDHCFATERLANRCDFAPDSRRASCETDGNFLSIYPLRIGSGSSVSFGAGRLYRLKECFDAGRTMHRYVIDDGTPLDASAPREVCRYLGYAPLVSWTRPDTHPVYAHEFAAATDRYFDADSIAAPIGTLMCIPSTNPTGWSVWQDP